MDFPFIDYPYAITMTRPGRISYNYNMNSFFDMVEKNVMIGRSYDFTTVKDLKATDDKNNNPGWTCNVHSQSSYNLNASNDWWLAFGGAQTALCSSVYCYKNDEGEIAYKAKIKYYCLDVYDWDGTDKYERFLNNLHTAGLARSFLDYGVYETEIEWIKDQDIRF